MNCPFLAGFEVPTDTLTCDCIWQSRAFCQHPRRRHRAVVHLHWREDAKAQRKKQARFLDASDEMGFSGTPAFALGEVRGKQACRWKRDSGWQRNTLRGATSWLAEAHLPAFTTPHLRRLERAGKARRPSKIPRAMQSGCRESRGRRKESYTKNYGENNHDWRELLRVAQNGRQ